MLITENRSFKIQLLRGLSIISVVFIHNTPGVNQVWCRPFINFGVGCFLFLSGLLTNINHWNPCKRIKKVLIPYIIWSFVYTILYNYKTPEQIPSLYVNNLITGQATAIMYYIFVYCELTLLLPVIDWLTKSQYKWIGMIISPTEIVFMRMMPIIYGFEWPPHITIIRSISFLGWFSYFYLGYLLGNGLIEFIQSNNLPIILGGGVLSYK